MVYTLLCTKDLFVPLRMPSTPGAFLDSARGDRIISMREVS